MDRHAARAGRNPARRRGLAIGSTDHRVRGGGMGHCQSRGPCQDDSRGSAGDCGGYRPPGAWKRPSVQSAALGQSRWTRGPPGGGAPTVHPADHDPRGARGDGDIPSAQEMKMEFQIDASATTHRTFTRADLAGYASLTGAVLPEDARVLAGPFLG